MALLSGQLGKLCAALFDNFECKDMLSLGIEVEASKHTFIFNAVAIFENSVPALHGLDMDIFLYIHSLLINIQNIGRLLVLYSTKTVVIKNNTVASC